MSHPSTPLAVLRPPHVLAAAIAFVGLVVACGDRDEAPEVAPPEKPAPPFDQSLVRAHRLDWLGADEGPWTLEERMSFYRVPGVSIHAWSGGRDPILKTVGEARRADPAEPVTTETVFAVGPELSHGIAALAFIAHVTESPLNLNEPVGELLAGFGIPPVAGRRTLAQLLSHTAGVGPFELPPGRTADEALRSAVSVFEPGTNWAFSETGSAVIQRFLEERTVRPFDVLARRILFEPLGLEHSAFGGARGDSPVATSYSAAGGRRPPTERLPILDLWSNPSEIGAVLQAMQDTRMRERRDIFSRRQLNFVVVPHVAGWSMGWETAAGVPWISEPSIVARDEAGGALVVARDEAGGALVVAATDRRAGAVIFTNGEHGSALAREILLGIAAHYGWTGIERIPVSRSAPSYSAMRRLLGTWDLNGRRFEIVWRDRLVLEPGRAFDELDGSQDLIEVGNNRWILMDSPHTFRLEEADRREQNGTGGLRVGSALAVRVDQPDRFPEVEA